MPPPSPSSPPSPPPKPQPVTARLTHAALFLVLTLKPRPAGGDPSHGGDPVAGAVKGLCANLSSLLRAIGFRQPARRLSCVMGIGSAAWDRVFGADARPKDLHPFEAIRGERHQAPSTPGDLLFHIRATDMDLCFELAMQVMLRLADATEPQDETHGFKYFDERDLLGFVDGTENPVDADATAATVIGAEDARFAGGSYVIVQKYLHDLHAWNSLPVERQEAIIGRKKLSDVELDEKLKKSYAHNVLTSIEDAAGNALTIVRDNMPFGRAGQGEFGTYFIGYAREPARIERMLRRMFVGEPAGNYDRLLDFSRAVTGGLFFAPSATFLDNVQASDEPPARLVAEQVPGLAPPQGRHDGGPAPRPA